MALTRVAELTVLTRSGLAVTDEVVVRDVSVGAGDLAGRRVTLTELIAFINANGGGGGSTPPAPATRFWGWSADTTFTAAEFTSAGVSGGVTIPAQTGNGYLALAVPSTAADITSVTEADDGATNIRSSFTTAHTTITLGGAAHKFIRTNQLQFGSGVADTWDWS